MEQGRQALLKFFALSADHHSTVLKGCAGSGQRVADVGQRDVWVSKHEGVQLLGLGTQCSLAPGGEHP